MMTFEQFLQIKKYIHESDEKTDDDILKVATNIGQANKKAVIGATDVKELPNIMKAKQAQDLVKKKPTAAADLGQVLTGVDANKLKQTNQM